MTIIVLVALGFSLLCTLILIGACVLSGQSANKSQGISAIQDDEERKSTRPAPMPIGTISTPLA